MTQQKPTKLPLLRSESPKEFLALRTRLNQEVKPQGVIEEFYFEDIVALVWEVKRLQGFRISTIQQACGPALRNLLEQLLVDPSTIKPDHLGIARKARVLTLRWLENDPAAKEQVAAMLGRVGLDEAAIEAEAMKLSVEHLHYLDRALTTARARLDKALRMVMDYRNSGFADRLRQKSDQILNEPQVPEGLDSGDAEQKAAA